MAGLESGRRCTGVCIMVPKTPCNHWVGSSGCNLLDGFSPYELGSVTPSK